MNMAAIGSDITAQGLTEEASQSTKVMVKMKSLSNGNEWLWDRAKFMDRRFLMQALYQEYIEDEKKSTSISGPPTNAVSDVIRLF